MFPGGVGERCLIGSGTEVPVLIEGGYSRRDQGGENPTFIVEAVTKLAELRTNGRVVVAIDLDPGDGAVPRCLRM